MDGVLVDVTESYRATIQATVKHFTGYEPTDAEIQDWKNRGGWNDDWQLSHRLIQERGGDSAIPRRWSTTSRKSSTATATTA